MANLAASTAHAALWGRTNYGRAFTTFAEEHADALGPRSSLLVLGDARSNYSDLALDTLRELAGSARHAWWLNPEHTRHWGTGDSAARAYGEVVPMVECRNLTQLGEFVHDIAAEPRRSAGEVAELAGCRSISARSSGCSAASAARPPATYGAVSVAPSQPSKTTVTRLPTPGVDQRAEQGDRVGAVLQRQHPGLRRGSAGTCADGAPAVTTWSTTKASDDRGGGDLGGRGAALGGADQHHPGVRARPRRRPRSRARPAGRTPRCRRPRAAAGRRSSARRPGR